MLSSILEIDMSSGAVLKESFLVFDRFFNELRVGVTIGSAATAIGNQMVLGCGKIVLIRALRSLDIRVEGKLNRRTG